MQFCHHFPLILITGMRIACDGHCYALRGSEKQAAFCAFRNLPQKGRGQLLSLNCFFKHYFSSGALVTKGRVEPVSVQLKFISLAAGGLFCLTLDLSFGVEDQVASWEGEEMHAGIGVWGLQVETSKKVITPLVSMVLEMYVSGSY